MAENKDLSQLSQEELLKKVQEQEATINELAGKVTAAEKALADTKEELALTVQVNQELTDTIEQLPKKESKQSPSFSVDGEEYEFVYDKTVIGGKAKTAADIIADESLQRDLVARKSGMIKKKG